MKWKLVSKNNKLPIGIPIFIATPCRDGYEYDSVIIEDDGVYSVGEFYEGFNLIKGVEYFAILKAPKDR